MSEECTDRFKYNYELDKVCSPESISHLLRFHFV
jgi:hypothetical protein